MKKAPALNKALLMRLYGYVKKYRRMLGLAVLFASLGSVLALTGPLLMGRAIDYITGPGQVEFAPILRLIAVMAALYLVSGVSQWFMQTLSAAIAARTAADIRKDGFSRLCALPLNYFDNPAHGDTISRFTNDIDFVADGLSQAITQLLAGLVTLLGTLGFMLSLSAPVTAVVVVLTPLSIWVAGMIVKRSTRMFREQSRILGELNGYVEEMVSGGRVVRAFGREKASEAQFSEINARLYKAGQLSQFYSSLANPSTRLINHTVYVCVGVLGALLAVGGNLSVGAIASFLTYAVQFSRPINEITGITTQLQSAAASLERVFALLDTPPQRPDAPEAKTDVQARGSVEFRDVSFSYQKDSPLIEHFSLRVSPGRTVAIVGPTGAGKTTIVNLLMRFYEIDSGAILLDGVDIRDISRDALRRSFGMVLQDSWLFFGTVRENIAYGRPDATMEEVERAARAAHAHGFIRRLPQGYDTVIAEDGGNISEGQKQLLTIARAMLSDPPMLILDEATSSVDTRTEQRIQRAFLALMQGRTSFVIAHRLSTIRTADVILAMDQGKIVEMGSHEELLKKEGFYFRLYNSQFAK
ncbi:MAG TPA: ABC transporter ATP-binding protein [Feifaniaceae bacterium]|nr:ABC transporter ATP-binding protein [Feifaniaceae bacterium]